MNRYFLKRVTIENIMNKAVIAIQQLELNDIYLSIYLYSLCQQITSDTAN